MGVKNNLFYLVLTAQIFKSSRFSKYLKVSTGQSKLGKSSRMDGL